MPKSKKKQNKSNKKSVNQKTTEKKINEVKAKTEAKEVKKDTKTNKTSKNNQKSSASKKVNNKKQAKNDNNKRWFRDFKAELKKIIWPNRSELTENCIVVISMVVIVALIIFALDLGFKELNNLEVEGAKQIKNSITVSSDNEVNEENSNTSSDEEGTQIDVNSIDTQNGVEAVWTNESSN